MKLTRKQHIQDHYNQYSQSDDRSESEQNSEQSSSASQSYDQRPQRRKREDSDSESSKSELSQSSSQYTSSTVTDKRKISNTKTSKQSSMNASKRINYDYQQMYVNHMHQTKDLHKKRKSNQVQEQLMSSRHSKHKRKSNNQSSEESEIDSQDKDSSDEYSATQRYYIEEKRERKKSKSDRVSHNIGQLKKNKANFDQFTQNFYRQRPNVQKLNQFETKYIKTQRDELPKKRKIKRQSSDESSEEFERKQDWKVKATKEGFLYFFIKGTNTYQWNFPRYYDPRIKKTKPYFVDKWIKKYDDRGKKFWQNSETKHIQLVKPDSESYFIQASILGNLAFLEVYLKCRGDLLLTDQQKRTGELHFNDNIQPYIMLRSGDTCMHIAAAYNSLDSMVIISNYGGFELLLVKNREGRRPIDVAEKMRNYECYEALQKLERNIQYQNAILERDINQLDKLTKQKKYRKNQIAAVDKSSRINSSQNSRSSNKYTRKTPKLNLKVIEEQSSEEMSEEDEGIQKLGGKRKYQEKMMLYQREVQAQEHQRQYLNQIKQEKKHKVKRSKEVDIPKFKDYDPKIKNMSKQKKFSERDEENQKNSYSKKSSRYRQDSEEEYNPHQSRRNKDLEKTQNYFHLSIREDSFNSSKIKSLQTARDKYLKNREKYEDNDYDDENQIVSRREPSREETGQSLVEKAITRTSTLVKTLGGYFKGGFDKIKEYVFQEDNRLRLLSGRSSSRQRAKSARNSQRRDLEDISDSSQYETPRRGQSNDKYSKKRAKTSRYAKNQVVPIDALPKISSSGSSIEERKQRNLGKKSRRIQPIQEEQNFKRGEYILESLKNDQSSMKQDKSSSQNKSSSSNTMKKSISIQADTMSKEPPVEKPQQKNQIISKQQSTASLKSIGVGSMNINESVHTQSQYSTQSQKLQHSRMIQREKKKRLGNKSRMLLNKNYQSSEDERKTKTVKNPSIVSGSRNSINNQQALNERSPSPAPKFMKEEIAFIKQQQMLEIQRDPESMSAAFSQKDLQEEFKEQQQLFTPSQRQLIKKTQLSGTAPLNNQRYHRNKNNSTSPSGNDLPKNTEPIKQFSSSGIQRQTTPNAYPIRAPTLLTQEQFDMIMLNSEDENARKNQKQNNLYQLNDTDKIETPKNDINQVPSKNEDIKKFYDDLIRNQSLTQIEELKLQEISESVDDTNLSNLYSVIMKNHLSQKAKGTTSTQATPTQVKENKKPLDESIFNPPEENNMSVIQYNDFDNQNSFDLMASILKDFEEAQQQNQPSFDQNPIQTSQTKYQSNILDKGQFVQNSCISMYGANGNQQNQSAIQRPLISGFQNNSMNNFNFQYQSDAESDYIPSKKGKLLITPHESPQKKRQQLIPPQLSHKSLAGSTQPPTLASEQKPQDLFSSLKNQHQKQIIDLFKEDEEQDRLQIKSNNFYEESKGQLPSTQTLADELKNTFNDLESVLNNKNSDQEFINLVNIESDDQIQVKQEQLQEQILKEKIIEKLEELKKVENKELSPKAYQGYFYEEKQMTKQNKKKNRYDVEDSLINFDLSQSKIDQGDKINIESDDQLLNVNAQSEPRKSLKEQIQEQRQSYIQEKPKVQEIKPKLECEVLPLKVLRPAYKRNEIQGWEGESHSLMDQESLKKNLLGNLMVQAFATSEKKIVRRQFLPYQGASANTLLLLGDMAATATANYTPLKKPLSILQKSITSLQSGPSQDSLVQELDSISRIYEDLETVQEEELGQEKTNTLEETKIQKQMHKSPRKIPRHEAKPSFGAGEEKIEKDQQMMMQSIFYKKEGAKIINPQSQQNKDSDVDEQANTIKWRRDEKQNRSTATAFIYNLQTSSEDEAKRFGAGGIWDKARPKRQMHGVSLIHGQQSSQVPKKTIKDVSFKSQNVSTHTETSERLKENLRNFQKNKIFGLKKQAPSQTSQDLNKQ